MTYSKEEILPILLHISRNASNQEGLLKTFPDAGSLLEEFVQEGLLELNHHHFYMITEKGMKTIRKLVEKRSHHKHGSKKKPPKRKGLIQLAILQLLKEAPRHGYQVMKLLEERSEGHYSPSTGTIYPALQDLLDRDFIGVHEQADKKVYVIHTTGLEYLKDVVQDEEQFWEDWRFKLMWKQSKEAALLKEQFEKFQLEYHYALRSVMGNPQKANDLISILEDSRQKLVNLSKHDVEGGEE